MRDVPAGNVVTIIGATIAYDDKTAPAVLVTSNPGAVRFDDLVVDQAANLVDASVRASVVVESTGTFWLVDSSIWSTTLRVGNTLSPLVVDGIVNDGISGLELTDTKSVLQNSRMMGYLNDYTVHAFGGDF